MFQGSRVSEGYNAATKNNKKIDFRFDFCEPHCFGTSHLHSAAFLCGRHPCSQLVCLRPVSRARARAVEPPTAFRRNSPSAPCPAGSHWGDQVSKERPDQSAVLVRV